MTLELVQSFSIKAKFIWLLMVPDKGVILEAFGADEGL
jgi:hypothetical protein